jgi:hypothetical protein
MTRFYTNAPDCYDYGYVQTLGPAKAGNCRGDWRLIEVSDLSRFESYQTPRYSSGMYIAVAVGSEDAAYFQLSAEVSP